MGKLKLFNRTIPKIDSYELKDKVAKSIRCYLFNNWDSIIGKEENKIITENQPIHITENSDHPIFKETIDALCKYEEEMINMQKDMGSSDEYFYDCMALEISKAFVYDLGWKDAKKFAKGILALDQLHSMR